MLKSFSGNLSYGTLSNISKYCIQKLAKQCCTNPSGTVYRKTHESDFGGRNELLTSQDQRTCNYKYGRGRRDINIQRIDDTFEYERHLYVEYLENKIREIQSATLRSSTNLSRD